MAIELADDNDAGCVVTNEVHGAYHKRLLRVLWTLQNPLMYCNVLHSGRGPRIVVMPLHPDPGFAIAAAHIGVFANFRLSLDGLSHAEIDQLHQDLSDLEEHLNLNRV